MKINVLDKDWELKGIDNKTQQRLYSKFMSLQPELKESGESVREQTQEEKRETFDICFECLELSGVEQPEDVTDQMILGMAIMNHYFGFDKKKLSKQG